MYCTEIRFLPVKQKKSKTRINQKIINFTCSYRELNAIEFNGSLNAIKVIKKFEIATFCITRIYCNCKSD